MNPWPQSPAHPPAACVSAQALREVRRGVAAAGDAQVLKVLRMVDALECRGGTDAVLDPVRSRLRDIHPVRPLRFARLLFMPLDPLIVPPKAWRPGTPSLSRAALATIAGAVRHVIAASGPAEAASLACIDGLIARADTGDAGVIRQAGRLLWPLAAGVLHKLGAPACPDRPKDDPSNAALKTAIDACRAKWTSDGLKLTELLPFALALATVLGNARALHDHEHAGVCLSADAVLDMLARAEATGPRAWGMMLGLLTIRMPQMVSRLLAIIPPGTAYREQAALAGEAALSCIEAEAAGQPGDISDAAPHEVARQAALTDALIGQSGDANHRRRAVAVKAQLLQGCVRRLENSLQAGVASPLQMLPDDAAGRGVALDEIEASARMIRRFEQEARRLGDGSALDALMKSAACQVTAATDLLPMDRARLMEIVAGPEAAMAMLRARDEPERLRTDLEAADRTR